MRHRAAVYARYSTDLQSPTSIADQVRLCEQGAAREGLTIVVRYQDAAISGTTTERPGYQQLVRAALARPPAFDIILCESLDRLTRDSAEATTLYKRLRLNSVDIVGVSDGTDTRRKGATFQVGVNGLKNALYLEDLSDKTHRGMAGRIARGLTAGGRCFGYGVVEGRFRIDEAMAAIVRRIWREYADGRSPKQIAHRLNIEGVPWPSHDTARGPARKGWTASSVRTILLNETYCGRLIWNRSQFMKDPVTGRRLRRARPREHWHDEARPELRLIPPELEQAVKARPAFVRQAYGPHARRDGRWIPPGRATLAYPSRHLGSGLFRCEPCGMAIVAHTTTRRKKSGRVYQQTWYHCAGATDKGPAVCRHTTRYRKDLLEGALITRFREATATPEWISRLAQLVNTRLEGLVHARGARTETLDAEISQLESQARNLLHFVAQGKVNGDNRESTLVREEVRRLEGELERRRTERAVLDAEHRTEPTQAHPTWIRDRLEHLDELLARDPARARVEIMKHLDGPLRIRPLLAPAGQRVAEIIGHVKPHSLLAGGQEAVCLRLVAGVGFEPTTFGL